MPGYRRQGSSGYNSMMDLDEIQRVNSRIDILTKYTPELAEDPMTAMALAQQQSSDDEMLSAALDTRDFAVTEQQLEGIRQAPEDYQRAWFSSQPKEVQEHLRNVGNYEPPSKDGGGWFGLDIDKPLDLIGVIPSAVRQVGAEVLPDIAGDTVNVVFGSIPRYLARSYRAFRYAEDRGSMWDLDHLHDSWNKVNKGEQTFFLSAEEAARDIAGNDDVYSLARHLAAGRSFEDIAGDQFEEDTPEYHQEVLRLYELSADENLEKAVGKLSAGKMSIGRAFANTINDITPLEDDYRGFAYDIVSGTIDGALNLVDPTIILGWLARGTMAAKYGYAASTAVSEMSKLSKARRVLQMGRQGIRDVDFARLDDFQALARRARAGEDMRWTEAKVARGVNEIAEMVSKTFTPNASGEGAMLSASDLFRRFEGAYPAWDDMVKFHTKEVAAGRVGLRDPDQWFEFLKTEEGKRRLAGNRLGGYGRVKNLVPHTTGGRTELLHRIRVAGGAKVEELLDSPKYLDRLAEQVEKGTIHLPSGQNDVITATARSARERVEQSFVPAPIRTFGRGLATQTKYLAQHVPQEQILKLADESSVVEFERLAESVGTLAKMPRQLIDFHKEQFAGAFDPRTGTRVFNEALRFDAAKTFLDDALYLAGAPKEVVERWSGRLAGYSQVTGKDLTSLGGQGLQRPQSMLPLGHDAAAIAIPNIRKLIPEFEARTLLDYTFGARPVRWTDAMIGKYWVPAVLIRLSFIPRAYGEELLQHFLNSSKRDFIATRLGMWDAEDKSIYARDTTARDLVRQREAVSNLSQMFTPADMREEFSRFAGWGDSMYDEINHAEAVMLRPATWAVHHTAHFASRMFPESRGARMMDVADLRAQYYASFASGIISPGMLATVPWRAAKKATVAAAKRTPLSADINEASEAWKPFADLADKDKIDAVKSLEKMKAQLGFYDEAMDGSRLYLQNTPLGYAEEAMQSEYILMKNADGTIDKLPSRLDPEHRVQYAREDPNYLNFQYRHIRRIAKDRVALEGVRRLNRMIDEKSLTRVDRLLTKHGIEGADGIERLNGLKKYIDTKITNKTQLKIRSGLLDVENGDLAKAITSLNRGSDEAKRLAAILEEAGDDAHLRAILRKQFRGDFELATRDDMRAAMTTSLKRAAYKPKNVPEMRRFARSLGSSKGRVARPIPAGMTPLYVPMIDQQTLNLIQSGIDEDQILEVFRREMHAIGHSDVRVEQVWKMMADPSWSFDDIAETNRIRRTWSDTDFTPAGMIGTSDYEVARALSQAIQEAAGVTGRRFPMVGQQLLPDEIVRRSGGADPTRAWKVTEGGSGVKSVGADYNVGDFNLDIPHLQHLDLIEPDQVMKIHKVEYPLPDGTVHTEWLDDGHYQAVTADIADEAQRPKILETKHAGGVSLDDALQEWAEALSDDMLDTFLGGTSGRTIDEIIERLSVDPRAFEGEQGFRAMFEVPVDELPASVRGETIVSEPPTSPWNDFVRNFFDGVVGPAGAAITRNHRFLDLIVQARRQMEPLLRAQMIDPVVDGAGLAIAKKVGVDDESLMSAWRGLSQKLRTDPTVDPDTFTDALVRRGLHQKDDALYAEFAKDGKVWGPVIGKNGEFDSKAFGALMAARREGLEPRWAKALTGDEISELRNWATMRANFEQHLDEGIVSRAFADVAPFLDDRRYRSMFQEIVGAFVPFQFAEEQFLKRWTRTLQQSPEALWEAQLMMNGLRNVGAIKTDPATGDEYYIYPGSAQATMAIGKGINFIFGREIVIPVAAGLTGEVKYTLPGLDGSMPGIPNGGPLMGVAVAGLSEIFPEVGKVFDPIVSRNQGRDIASYFVPTTLARAWDVVSQDETQMASATVEAMQYLEATGHGLPDDAPPAAIDAYQQRVKNHARILLGVRLTIGFAGPAAPQRLAPGHKLSEELTMLLRSGMPATDAMAAFIKKNPDATPYTVFRSESTSEAPLPQTADALNWMVQNKGYIRSFKQAAPWLIPQREVGDEFERKAYYEQLSQGLRTTIDMEEWYDKMKFRGAASEYFDSRENLEIALMSTDDPNEKRMIRESFATWSRSYLNQHPLFAAQLRSPDAAAARVQAVNEMELIINDPDAPESPVMEAMREVVASWRNYETSRRAFGTSRAGAVVEEKERMKVSFGVWLESFRRKHPEIKDFVQSILMPQLDLTLAEEVAVDEELV